MEADVEGLIGAGRHERSAERLNYRNGYRERSLDTRLGSLQLRIPKPRQGSYFPPFLEPRKTAEKALVTVIQEAWIGGVSTRRVDEVVQATGSPASRKAKSPSSVRTLMTGSTPSSIARSRASGRTVARRHLSEGPQACPSAGRGRPHRLGRGDNRRGGNDRRPARDRRARHRSLASRAVLVELHQGSSSAGGAASSW